MRRLRTISLVLVLAALGTSRLCSAEEKEAADPKGVAFFESKIRPVLVENCYQCHSARSGKSEGELLLDTRESLRTGGSRGPAVVPGKPEESWLLTAISHTDPDLQMPPKRERLPQQVIRDFEQWIKLGAPDPRSADAPAARASIDLEAGRRFWAYQKPQPQVPPQTKDASWARRPLDQFILARLEDAGLSPSPDATPRTLLRRLCFDLIGLPPTPEQIEAFEKAAARDLESAIASVVDELLASPHFGERWGRHWLDVARFAESSGKEANISFPYAFRYRDYVIDCFNEDLPMDRFLTEQIAGDLLPYEDDAERARLLIATGFLAIGPKNLDEGNGLQFLADVIDEQIDAVSRAMMATSIACARCHDHKFDPFSMEDYYALAGIFASTKTYFGTAVSPANRVGGDPLPLPRTVGLPVFHPSIPPQRVQQLKEQLAALKKEQEEATAAAFKALKEGKKPEKEFTIRDALRIFWTSGAIEGQLEKVDEEGRALTLGMGVLDREKIIDVPLLDRGEITKPLKPVPRAFPKLIQLEDAPAVPSHQSGRLELARWLTHPDHPLTARVLANRVWRHLLGEGIVATVDNFGFSGERPSHPELLDHLATELVAGGWSIKKLIREIALSRTYRQASTYRPDAFQADPDNRLLWRANKRRLEAEAIRDAMLAVSGELDTARPEGSLVARLIGDRPISLIGLDKRLPPDLDGSVHRSVYLPVLRDRLPDVLDLFDFAEPSLVTGDRETTNVPLQALYLMNSTFVQDRAKGLAARLVREADDDAGRIRRAFMLCFGRPPDETEAALAAKFLADGAKQGDDDTASPEQVLTSYCQAMLATAEFRNID